MNLASEPRPRPSTLETNRRRDRRSRVASDPTVRDGVVSITHGHADANPGDLTSGDVDVDPLTAMPACGRHRGPGHTPRRANERYSTRQAVDDPEAARSPTWA